MALSHHPGECLLLAVSGHASSRAAGANVRLRPEAVLKPSGWSGVLRENLPSALELDCSRVRTFEEVAEWAIKAFGLPFCVTDLPTSPVPGLFFTRQEISMDALTDRIYHHLGKNRLSFTVRLKNYRSASKHLLLVLDHPTGWRRAFSAGLPRDYSTLVVFEL